MKNVAKEALREQNAIITALYLTVVGLAIFVHSFKRQPHKISFDIGNLRSKYTHFSIVTFFRLRLSLDVYKFHHK